MNKKFFIPSVNFHIWETCNMKCKYCFATFQDVKQSILPKGHLEKDEAVKIVKLLADFGFQKITFAGGEPTLCRWLPDLIKTAKNAGMKTMIVTNGNLLNNKFLEINRNNLDWISISIDSLNELTNLKIGRAIAGKKALQRNNYIKIVDNVLRLEYRLKINTVVNRSNFNEDMNDFIQYAKPERWKVLQTLPVEGQNDKCIDDLSVSREEFMLFVHRHRANKCLVSETDKQMVNSYVMIDPAGRFFNNETGKYIYSRKILESGIENTFREMNYDPCKFKSRKGLYLW
ncbi:MAG: viperin family antiviral radical SAM protein [Bacteroidota bacterium]